MKARIAYFLAGLLAVACAGRPQPTVEEPVEKILPPGAIPMEYIAGHVYLHGTVCDSLPVYLLFDTGADLFYVDSLWFARSGYVPTQMGKAVMRGGGGSNMVFLRLIQDSLILQTGIASVTSRMTPVLDFKNINGRKLDGIIGHSPMKDRCLEINYSDQYLRYVAADTLEAAGYTKLPFRMTRNRIYVPMRIQIDSVRVLEGDFMLDLGCRTGVTLTVPAGAKLDLKNYPGKKVFIETISGGVGGAASAFTLKADSVTFAGFKMPSMVVDASQNTGGSLTDDHYAGLLGNSVLERFSLVIDYLGRVLYLKPNADFGKPDEWIAPGFSVIDRTDICDGWIVTGLYEGYIPEGLQVRDTVVSWDGQDVQTLDIRKVPKEIGSHTLGIRRGEQVVEIKCETTKIF